MLPLTKIPWLIHRIPGYPGPRMSASGPHPSSVSAPHSKSAYHYTQTLIFMASASRRTTYPSSAASRASLACVPCRQKHVKCDAKRPVCDRCTAEDKICHFLNSRRGGLTRSALAERRRFLQDQRQSSPSGDIAQHVPSEQESGPQQEEPGLQPTLDEGYASRSAPASSSTPADPGSTSIQDLLDQDWNASGDHYIGLYYKHFHHLHPFVLPRRYLDKML